MSKYLNARELISEMKALGYDITYELLKRWTDNGKMGFVLIDGIKKPRFILDNAIRDYETEVSTMYPRKATIRRARII